LLLALWSPPIVAQSATALGDDLGLTALLAILTDQESSTPERQNAAKILGNLSDRQQASDRQRALVFEKSVEPLVERLRDPHEANEVIRSVMEALRQMAPESVQAVRRTLTRSPPSIRQRGADLLGTMGKDAAQAVESLVDAMADGDDGVRGSATKAIAKIAKSLELYPRLQRALKDSRESVRAGAAIILGQINGWAASADLIELLDDANDYVRYRAADALTSFGKGAVSALRRALRDGTRRSSIRGGSAYILGQIGPEARDAVEDLTAVLDARNMYLCASAADALGRIHLVSKDAVDKLRPLLRAPSGEVRSGAAFALG
jgi:HEAT repeat protein